MMMPEPRSHGAHYDENGDIVLETDGAETAEVEGIVTWHVTDTPPSPEDILEPQPDDAQEQEAPIGTCLRSVRRHITEDVLEEGIRQFAASFDDAKPLIAELEQETESLLRRFTRILREPVWVPGKKKYRPTSRGMLFLADTLRFGGTFLLIFLTLFAALNYQSFWILVSSRAAALVTQSGSDSSERALASALQEKLQLLPSLATAGASEGNILSVLPLIGPPGNRIVIPRLDLNVPLVTPPYEALLAGDWTQVEQDIQQSLQGGVVHYPGTANPGQAGNFFVTGHSSYYPWSPGSFKTVFARLQELQIGDEYWVYFGGDRHRYVIRTRKEVSPADITVLDQPVDKRLATLMTCTPVGTTLRRLIVVAEEVDPQTGATLKVGERAAQPRPKISVESLPI